VIAGTAVFIRPGNVPHGDGLRVRHTYAALMVAAGAHLKYLQAQMGHSSSRVTLDLYGHLFPDANRGVLDTLDELTAPSTSHRKSASKNAPKEKVPESGDFGSGSDGTRTRDLRRDRPVQAQPLRSAATLNYLLEQAFSGRANRLWPAMTGYNPAGRV
jgi:hypothetical protein